ncbi:hypothetical protein [Streptomyces sp. NPDC051636]|uniref:hypothetical protein n=1 Tax=Streptomyces sp. NPDC051636 TaxID=3365663 RepID=UPI0037A2B550
MSYDLAVWEGAPPADDEAAGKLFDALYDQYVAADEEVPPTPAISAYVSALLDQWPDLTEDEDDISPWSTEPLINEASGPFIYFPMRYSMADEAREYAANVAASMGLVCYDPQHSQLLT